LHWAASGNGIPKNAFVSAIAIDPVSPATLFAGTYAALFKSTNGGMSWNASSHGLPLDRRIHTIAIDPSDSATIYAGTAGAGTFKSTDGGANWAPTGDAAAVPAGQSAPARRGLSDSAA
jgi:photosystem II stability/assembly factor-like uncharacterized protein